MQPEASAPQDGTTPANPQASGLLEGLKQRALQQAGGAVTRGVITFAEQVTRAIERTSDARRTFFDPMDFPFTSHMEKHWRTVREELDALMRGVDVMPNFQDIQQEQRELTTDDRWKTFVLYGYGVKLEDNCRRCPMTTRLVESIPGMTSAMFSILRGPKHIPPHNGHYKGVLRYHLGLIVPEPEKNYIRVGQDKASWQEGQSLIFDDTHEHEVRKESEGDRVVLFVDFLRPLPPVLDTLNRLVVKTISLSPYIRQGEKNLQQWEEYFGQELDQRRGASGRRS